MPREADPSNPERDFVLEALLQGLRKDGRGFDQFRPIDVAFGEEFGSATVTLGKTRLFKNLFASVVRVLS